MFHIRYLKFHSRFTQKFTTPFFQPWQPQQRTERRDRPSLVDSARRRKASCTGPPFEKSFQSEKIHDALTLQPLLLSGVAPANQTKERSVHELFAGHSGTKIRYENRACFRKEKHQNSQKWAKFMNFSLWPFLWFGLPGRLLILLEKKAG